MSAAKKVALAALTIGGLPAERFDTRRVKVTLADGVTTTGVCRGTYKKSIVVDIVVDGRLRQHHVSPSKVKPFWVDNPDLHVEAKSLGAVYDGNVSVGRALEEANTKTAADALAKAKAELAEVAATKAAAAVTKAEREAAEAALPRYEEVVAPPAPAQPDYASITGVTASMTADPTWVTDFADLQSLLNERKGRHGRIAELQAKLAALETELASLGSRFADDEEMVALYAESLVQKGVTLSWDTPVAADPVAGPKVGSFESHLRSWLTDSPVSFTYRDVWDALGASDQAHRRSMVCRMAAADYHVVPSTRGRPQLFVRKDG